MILTIRFWLSKQAGFPVRKPQQCSYDSNYKQAFSLSCTRQQYIYLFLPAYFYLFLPVSQVLPIGLVLLHFPVLREIDGKTHASFMWGKFVNFFQFMLATF